MVQIVIANIIDFVASMIQIYSGTMKDKGKIQKLKNLIKFSLFHIFNQY